MVTDNHQAWVCMKDKNKNNITIIITVLNTYNITIRLMIMIISVILKKKYKSPSNSILAAAHLSIQEYFDAQSQNLSGANKNCHQLLITMYTSSSFLLEHSKAMPARISRAKQCST